MEDLNEAVAKLELHKSRPFSPLLSSGSRYCADGSLIPEGKVASLANTFQKASNVSNSKNSVSKGLSQQSSPNGIGPKKVAPIVPPKPQKQLQSPEVPQSMLVQQASEPLYSKRLQSNGGHNHTNKQNELLISSSPSILNRKQPQYGIQNSYYSKINKKSLDNPAILEQQLEALAHHKIQMEKKGLLQNQGQMSSSFDTISETAKVSTDSYVKEHKNLTGASNKKDSGGENLNIIYSNVCVVPSTNSFVNLSPDFDKKSTNVYSNIQLGDSQVFGNNVAVTERVGSGVYQKLHLGNDADRDFPPPPTTVMNAATTQEIPKHLDIQIDDDIPSPPSPVSSSYSELRRATDVFSKIAAPIESSHPSSHALNIRLDAEAHANNLYYPQYVGNPNARKLGAFTTQQNYMNMNFNNEYGNYNESASLQSISQGSSDYYGYGSYSQGSSSYESIYEPINPSRQLSAQSNDFLYMHNANGSQTCGMNNADSSGNISSLSTTHKIKNLNQPVGEGSCQRIHLTEKHHNHKEVEVEALTDFIVPTMDSTNDSDNYGICAKCNERVVGENSGCTAMDQIYHISCFTCSQCQINLQGKPFYSLEDNPYCEYDYLQTLEKCSVCMKPILERILRATGKPYHPQCFTCVVCGNSLDGTPFTVDATNQNYCIADFHKKFAPRCCVCKLPIMPEQGQEETVRVVALDRSFHFECYKCEDCGLLLSSEAEGRGCYPLDDHVLCKSCNAKQVQMLTKRMTSEL